MSFESLMGVVQRLNASTETLAALGAELRLRRDAARADPETRRLMQDIVRSIDPTLLDGVSPQQEALALAVIDMAFHHAVDLLEDPARWGMPIAPSSQAAGWCSACSPCSPIQPPAGGATSEYRAQTLYESGRPSTQKPFQSL
jgi:hypothetical protein